jgi:hypothetical protein
MSGKRKKQQGKRDEKEANEIMKITVKFQLSGMRGIECWIANVSTYTKTSIYRVSVVGFFRSCYVDMAVAEVLGV